MKHFNNARNYFLSICLLFTGLFFVFFTNAQTTTGRAFNLAYSSNLKGGHVAFGNTSMAIYKSDNVTVDLVKMDSFLVLANGQTSPYTNNSTNMRFVDVDNDAKTTNSSTADLVLPSGTNTIQFARLYWGARVSVGQGGVGNINLRKIKIRKGTTAAYDSVIAPITQVDKLLAEGTDSAYSCYVDITSYIQNYGAGTYSIANIVGENAGSSSAQGYYAGWTIVVAYQNTSLPYSSVRIYDGFHDVGGSNGNSFSTTLNGFNAPASTLDSAGAYMTAMGWEGDAVPIGNSLADYLLVNGDTVKNALNPGSNFWNSTISNNGAFVNTKNPNYKTQMGIDLDEMNVGVGYGILPNATSATIQYGTTGDHYYPTMFAFTMKTKDPTITIVKSVTDSLAPFNLLQPSEAVTYTMSGTNVGVGPAYNCLIVDTLPSNIAYIPGSLSVIANSGNSGLGVKTDVAGDDIASATTINSKTVIKFYIGTGATNSAGGVLQPGDKYSVSFRARAFADPNLLSAVSNTASITGNALSGDPFVDQSTVIIEPIPQGGSIGHLVWNDYNGNGIQDAGEPGLAGDTVTLTYPNSFTGTAITDANGYYSFTALQAGSYSVKFSTPSGYGVSPAKQGTDSTKDSNPVGGIATVTLGTGQSNTTIDAGFICHGTHNALIQTSCESYLWNGTTYTTSGVYTYAYSNGNGCPSVDTLNLTINNGTHNVSTQTSCESYLWNGTTYTTSGVYTYAYSNGNGCPSVDTLNLTINNGTHNISTQTSCESYLWNGTTYTTSGVYTYAYSNGNGCPSVDTLNLTINNGTHNVSTQTSCESYLWNGTTYTTSGVYTYAYSNGNGCPSVDTLNLTINNGTHNVSTQTSCESYLWNGTTYTTSGVYTYAYSNGNGCPSVDTLNLTINNGTHNVSTQTSCESYLWNGTTYTTSGVYTYAYSNDNGCPSIDTLNLTINNGTHNVSTQTSCESYLWNGTTYTTSGVYTYAYSNGNGCPSVDTLNLTINNGTHNSFTQTAYNFYVWNDSTYIESGTYTFNYFSDNGCPSVDTLHLSIIQGGPLPVKISLFTVKKENSSALVNWTSVSELQTSEYEIQQSTDGTSFSTIGSVKANGNSLLTNDYHYFANLSNVNAQVIYYRLKVLDINGNVSFTNIISLHLSGTTSANFAVYPNPFVSSIKLQIQSQKDENVVVKLLGINGQTLVEQRINLQTGDNINVLNGLDVLPKGVYTIEVISTSGIKSQRIIK